jgi:hypothetical protein
VLAVEMTFGALGWRLMLASGGVTIHDPLDPLAEAAKRASMLLFVRGSRRAGAALGRLDAVSG